MASIDNVQDLSPRVQYTASAAQVNFTYPFPIFQDADLVVDVDGVVQTLTTDYTVTGEGNDNGGTVTFVVAMTGGEIVTIYRDIPIERDTDFSQNAPFSSASFNDELDKITLILQELENKIGRAIRFPQTATITNAQAEMEPLSGFLDKFLHVSSAGLLEGLALTNDILVLADELASIAAITPTAGSMLVANGTDYDGTSPDLTWLSNKLGINGALVLTERAAALADVAGQGQLFVRSDTPNVLIFRDDAGNETQLGSDQILVGNGTAALPSYGFTSEPDTGFYQTGAANQIGVALNGTQRWFFEPTNDQFASAASGGPSLRNVAPTAIGPAIHPNQDDLNTGIGYPANDAISLATGGIAAVQYAEVSSEIIQANDMAVGITASVTQTQGQQALLSSYNEISTVANANDVVTLPAASVGRRCIVVNNGANTLQVFPASGDDLGAGVNNSETIAAGASKIYLAHDSTTWNPIGTAQAGGAAAPGVNGCKVYNTAIQPITSGATGEALAFNAEAYDTNSLHDNVTNNTRITVPSGVTRIRLTGYVEWETNSGSYRTIWIKKNGADGDIDDSMTGHQPFISQVASLDPANWGHNIDTGIITVASGDYFELWAEQSFGSDVDVQAGSWFQCEVIE